MEDENFFRDTEIEKNVIKMCRVENCDNLISLYDIEFSDALVFGNRKWQR